IYGRTYRTKAVVTLGAHDYNVMAWLQYWFFYYYNVGPDNEALGIHLPGDHEGDWEMIQIGLDSLLTPVLAVFSQHKRGSWVEWSQIETYGLNGDRPVVYVAVGDHSSHFHGGSLDIPDVGS